MVHMTNYENAAKWATGTAYFPIRKDVFESEMYSDYIAGKTITESGEVIYEPGLKSIAAKVAWTQNSWFYTNVAFNGSDISRAQVELIVQNVLLSKDADVESVIASAFATAKDNLKNYIVA